MILNDEKFFNDNTSFLKYLPVSFALQLLLEIWVSLKKLRIKCLLLYMVHVDLQKFVAIFMS